MAKSKKNTKANKDGGAVVAATDHWGPEYPTGPRPKCPTCGQTLPSDHALVTVDKKKLSKAVKKAQSEFGGPMQKGIAGSR
jgi:hypothetical protein